MTGHTLHPRTVAAISRAWRCGETVKRIAHRLGLSTSTVRRRARAMGLPPRKQRVRPKTLASIRKRRARGETWRSIQRALGVSPETMIRALRGA